MSERRKLIIDCDPGNDDAMAILMALACPDVDVIAITCVEGNIGVKQTGLNALRVLKVAERMDIPVYLGCSAPLLGEIKRRSQYHGSDGLGQRPDPNAPDESHLQPEHAVLALIRLAKEHKGNIHLAAIGPLTNVAMAIRMDPCFGQNLSSCSIMGGNYHGKGNITVAGEFNFYFDPEAAYVTLNQLGCPCPILILPWETCMQHGVSFENYYKTRNKGTPKANFMKLIDEHSFEFLEARSLKAFVPADEDLMACVLNSGVIKDSVRVYASVETSGKYTSGQMVVDWKGLLGKEPNVVIVTELDQSLFEKMMSDAL